jgi:hypothetical protein
VVDLWMPSELPADRRERMENVAHTCPVMRTLHPRREGRDPLPLLTVAYGAANTVSAPLRTNPPTTSLPSGAARRPRAAPGPWRSMRGLQLLRFRSTSGPARASPPAGAAGRTSPTPGRPPRARGRCTRRARPRRPAAAARLVEGHGALAQRLLGEAPDPGHQVVLAVADVVQHLGDRVAGHHVVDEVAAARAQRDLHRVGVAEEVVQVAEDLLVGARPGRCR